MQETAPVITIPFFNNPTKMEPSDPASYNARGNRTLLETFDFIAGHNPQQAFAAEAFSSDTNDGFRDVTYGELSRAVDTVAYMCEQKYGIGKDFETIMFIGGPSDLTYAIMFFALRSAGTRYVT